MQAFLSYTLCELPALDALELGEVNAVPRNGEGVFISNAKEPRWNGVFEVKEVFWDLDLGHPDGPRHWVTAELERVE